MNKRFFSRKSITTLAIIGALFLLIFLDSRGMVDGVTDTGNIILSPVLRSIRAVTARIMHVAELPFSYQTLSDINRELTEENIALRTSVIQFGEVERENAILRAAIDAKDREKFNIVLARVLYRETEMPGEYLLVDAGESRGVRGGMAVVSPSFAFVGVIVKTSGDFSHVRLVADSSSVLGALTQHSRVLGTVKGELGTSLSFYFDASPDSQLREGEVLITSGFDKGIPRGLAIGDIGERYESLDRVEQRALVLPFSDFSHLEEVFIITNTK